jgi:pimeloyl-ACP methyl ester carboxylesterase
MGTADVDALGALIERVDAARVVLFGWSAGAGTSVVAATKRRSSPTPPTGGRGSEVSPLPRSGRGEGEGFTGSIVGVIAEAPYRLPWTPARNVLRGMGMPWRVVGTLAFAAMGVRLGVGPTWKGKGGFDRGAHARNVECPLLVLHGSEDEVCPIEDGEAIARAAKRGEIAVIPGGHHNDLWTDDRLRVACARVVKEFLTSVRAP